MLFYTMSYCGSVMAEQDAIHEWHPIEDENSFDATSWHQMNSAAAAAAAAAQKGGEHVGHHQRKMPLKAARPHFLFFRESRMGIAKDD